MRSETVLFDLDGTLSDAAAGMVASLTFACRRLGLEVPEEAVLRRFIGPPLPDTFAAHFGLDARDAQRALLAYRERYVDGGGMLETATFPGIPDLLDALDAAGARLAVATSKPTVFARQVVEHLGFSARFAAICGADLAGRRAGKAEVIGEACLELDLDPVTTTMVGDREHDVFGARQHGIDCIGVLWGYGSRQELESAGAVAVAERPDDVARWLLG